MDDGVSVGVAVAVDVAVDVGVAVAVAVGVGEVVAVALGGTVAVGVAVGRGRIMWQEVKPTRKLSPVHVTSVSVRHIPRKRVQRACEWDMPAS